MYVLLVPLLLMHAGHGRRVSSVEEGRVEEGPETICEGHTAPVRLYHVLAFKKKEDYVAR